MLYYNIFAFKSKTIIILLILKFSFGDVTCRWKSFPLRPRILKSDQTHRKALLLLYYYYFKKIIIIITIEEKRFRVKSVAKPVFSRLCVTFNPCFYVFVFLVFHNKKGTQWKSGFWPVFSMLCFKKVTMIGLF